MEFSFHTFLIMNVAIFFSSMIYLFLAPKLMVHWRSSGQLVFLGHFMVVVCIATPLAVKLLPGQVFKTHGWAIVPPSEGGLSAVIERASLVKQEGQKTSTSQVPSTARLWKVWPKHISFLDLALIVLALGSLFALGRLGFSLLVVWAFRFLDCTLC